MRGGCEGPTCAVSGDCRTLAVGMGGNLQEVSRKVMELRGSGKGWVNNVERNSLDNHASISLKGNVTRHSLRNHTPRPYFVNHILFEQDISLDYKAI